ncbi:putative beta-lysine N-acetyltransferase [Pseudodesulfovibrio piezophilus]|nr:putative beta-lysine N-acetyltransferase [Pseudodesulfovibrio piezophilus]
MQPDEIIHLGESTIQHGPANDRVYLMKLASADLPNIVNDIYELGRQHGYTKLFAKVPAQDVAHFAALGFIDEARVPFMHKGETAGYFMSKYMDQRRGIPQNIERISEVLELADQKAGTHSSHISDNRIIRLRLEHADELAELYGKVFTTYPFPVSDAAFIEESMKENTVFFGIISQGRLVAAASMEIDTEWQCAEMTDFATLPQHRGTGAAGALLLAMEYAAKDLTLKTLFTIARAESFGMNIVFARAGYLFGGTLHNNTQIAGKLESMNVWHKQILPR